MLECGGHAPAHETLRQQQTGTDETDRERYEGKLGSGGRDRDSEFVPVRPGYPVTVGAVTK